MAMRVKICGITQPEQGQAIAQLGATTLGFICVPQSKRYVNAQQIKAVIAHVPPSVDCIGVFANAHLVDIVDLVEATTINGVQLHGDEPPEFCQQLKQALPQVEIIKALRVKTPQSLTKTNIYLDVVDTLLLDAYHPHLLGGTGETINWEMLHNFNPGLPWLLAGGLTPDNVLAAIRQVQPSGIDLSSGVERAPGDKDLTKVALLFEKLRRGTTQSKISHQ